MANCKDCVHNDMCYLTHIDISSACCEFLDKNNYVEVVRCKDCKHYTKSPMGGNACITHYNGRTELIPRNDNDFCSYGERREGE